MKLTAREIIRLWVKAGVNLANIELTLNIPQGSLKLIYETEGPSPAEEEILLNMINSVPSLLYIAQENFDLKRLIVSLFNEWKENQKEIMETLI